MRRGAKNGAPVQLPGCRDGDEHKLDPSGSASRDASGVCLRDVIGTKMTAGFYVPLLDVIQEAELEQIRTNHHS